MSREESAPVAEYSIDARGITKSFGTHLVLKGIDLQVAPGECVSLFGPNGAGKTTLIKVLATLTRPSKGTACLAGLELRKQAVAIRREVGVVSHQTYLYDNLTAYENLKFYGRMYGVPSLEERIIEVSEQVGLGSRLHDRVGILSRGMQQRLSIARATIHRPSIMLLDEPESGLDERSAAMLAEFLGMLRAGGRTVLMATHNLERGFELGNRVIIMNKGRIAYEASRPAVDMATLRSMYHRCTEVGS